jgi:hypothetical protein
MLAELHRQRQVLQHAQETLDETSADLRKGEATVKTMARRARFPFF